eukprot:GHVS01040555.1.p1 GENE.GHVS01040555.1~~GHVS01040555.1.p1  ORF type:complete len:361 (-),score=13.11 GHVS01040555.1:9-1016(-)
MLGKHCRHMEKNAAPAPGGTPSGSTGRSDDCVSPRRVASLKLQGGKCDTSKSGLALAAVGQPPDGEASRGTDQVVTPVNDVLLPSGHSGTAGLPLSPLSRATLANTRPAVPPVCHSGPTHGAFPAHHRPSVPRGFPRGANPTNGPSNISFPSSNGGLQSGSMVMSTATNQLHPTRPVPRRLPGRGGSVTVPSPLVPQALLLHPSYASRRIPANCVPGFGNHPNCPSSLVYPGNMLNGSSGLVCRQSPRVYISSAPLAGHRIAASAPMMTPFNSISCQAEVVPSQLLQPNRSSLPSVYPFHHQAHASVEPGERLPSSWLPSGLDLRDGLSNHNSLG